MAASLTREYELVLMLDPEMPDERRDQIASEARGRIESGGDLKHDSAWGMRKLAYEIRQRTEADYRLFRFEAGGTLLDDLSHNLRIADGVLRFRIFKVDPASPVIVPPAGFSVSASAPGRGGRRPGGRGQRDARSEAPPAEAPPAEAPAAAPPAAAPSDAQPAEAGEGAASEPAGNGGEPRA